MSQPFTLPLQIPLSTSGGLLAGAKLRFYLTTTVTPQDVYSDPGLTTPISQPVTADSNGVFPVIYLGRTHLYTVALTNAAGVGVSGYPVDDIGPDTATVIGAAGTAVANTFTATQKISDAEPRLILDETDAGTDKRLWDFDIQAGVLSLRTRTDADGSGVSIATVTRGSTTGIASMQIGSFPLAGRGILTPIVRTSDGSSSSTTLANDSQLVAAIDTTYCTTYLYELFAVVYGGAGGISFNMNYSGSYTGSGVSNTSGVTVYNGTGAILVAKTMASAVTSSLYSTATLAATNPQDYLHIRGKLKAITNGTLAFSYGLNSASGIVNVTQGSWLSITPIG